ncbi:hypothetical protein CEP54_014781 [Fusarium duplospermum]|uniref:Uncharacterized protein n=1 Tax=Fusarium duplospermum TaxID=1325734 RepID=A0A428NTT1_9HYPO|nr:hypothetical protein CEP54_014781 [Fusarium duplospermum]
MWIVRGSGIKGVWSRARRGGEGEASEQPNGNLSGVGRHGRRQHPTKTTTTEMRSCELGAQRSNFKIQTDDELHVTWTSSSIRTC